VLRRLASTRLLPLSVLLTATASVAVITALATFGSAALPAAMHQRLAKVTGTTIQLSAQIDAARVTADTPVIGSTLHAALRDVPFTLLTGRWSDQFSLPRHHGSNAVPQLQAAGLPAVTAHAVLVSGHWPGTPRPGQPVGVALPAAVAGTLAMPVGSVTALRDSITGTVARFRVTGLYRPRDRGSPYWRISLLGTSGRLTQDTFVTYGPALVSPAALGQGRLGTADASWLATVNTAAIKPAGVAALSHRLTTALASLQGRQSLGGLQVTSGLPSILSALATSVVATRSLLAIGMLELALLVAAAASLAGRLLVSQREGETALLSARGAARGQLARASLAEAVLLAAAGVAAGILLGSYLAHLLMTTARLPAGPVSGMLRDAAAGTWWLAALLFVLVIVTIGGPALRPSSPAAARLRRGRQAALATAAQAGLDVAIIVLAAAALWELRRYSALPRLSGGGLGIDPVLTLSPALAIAGTALLPLRLLPATARLLDKLSARGKRVAAALASWQISRRPLRQGGPLLLVVLAAATGTLAIAQHQSWRQSQLDRAAFVTGADAKVTLGAPLPLGRTEALVRQRGVRGAMPVSNFNGGIDVYAIGAGSAASTVLLRRDLSPLPPATLWKTISPRGSGYGLMLPGRPARLEIGASIRPPPGQRLGAFSVSVSVRDGWGIVYSVPAGTLPADGHTHRLAADLAPTGQARYPLRMLGVSLAYRLPGLPANSSSRAAIRKAAAPRATLSVGWLAGPGRAGAPFAHGSELAGWQAAAGSAQLADPHATGVGPRVVSERAAGDAASLTFAIGDGQLVQAVGAAPLPVKGQLALTAAGPPVPVPAVATSAFLRASGSHLGQVVPVPVGNTTVLVRLAARIRAFPGTGPGAQVLIVDQGWLQGVLASQALPPLPVTQWWLWTAHGPPAAMPAGATVTSRPATAAALLSDPLPNVPQLGLLVITLAAAVLAGVGVIVSVTAAARERRPQEALLAALGMSRAERAGQFCLEQLMLSVSGAAAGALIGVLLAHLLVPAVTLTSAATVPFPPVLVQIPLGWLGLLVLAVVAVPVLAAATAAAYQPDPAGQLRAGDAA
jgi:FtsX-like permease family